MEKKIRIKKWKTAQIALVHTIIDTHTATVRKGRSLRMHGWSLEAAG
jgi:hypothetical protein